MFITGKIASTFISLPAIHIHDFHIFTFEPIINLNIFPLCLKIVNELLSVVVFCNVLVTGNHPTFFQQGEKRGQMRDAEVSQRQFFNDFVPKREA